MNDTTYIGATAMRSILQFIAGVVGLAIACRFLLPGTWAVTIQSSPIAKSYHYQSVVFWLVLAIGAMVGIVKLVRR